MRRKNRNSARNSDRQRGVAIIAAVVSMAILGAILIEFTTNTNVDLYAARNAELDMKAHFLAQSGMNLAELVIKVQGRIDGLDKSGSTQLGDFVPQLIGAFGGSKEERDSWAELVGGLSADDIKGLGVPEGEFSVAITTEDNKININCAKTTDTEQKKALYFQLANLFYPEAYNPIFESPDAEGWQRDRDTQIKSIIDYVDDDRYVFDLEDNGRILEDYGYETLRDKYKPKDQKLDTTDEIKLARGVDDRLWNLFGSSFTVYGDCKLNLASVTDVKLIAAIIAYAAADAKDPVVNDQVKLWRLAQKVKEARDFGLSFSDTKEFVDLVKDPAGGLAGFLDKRSAQGLPTAPEATQGGPPVEGVELDKAKLDAIARTGPRITYRVEATAYIHHGGLDVSLEKRIVGIWGNKERPRQNSRAYGTQQKDSSKGFWVYWRED